jgi:diguanylate cyclase (GGDEF)-like protein
MQSSSNSPRLQLDSASRRELLLQAYRGVLALILLGFALSLALFETPAQIVLGIAVAVGIAGERLTVAGRVIFAARLLIALLAFAIFVLAWVGDGVNDSALYLYGPLMVLAVIFLPLREYIVCAVVIACSVCALGLATLLSWITPIASSLAWQVWPHIIIFLIAHCANAFMLNSIVSRIGGFVLKERNRLTEERAVWHQAAFTDVLSGVFNRRGFMDYAEHRHRGAQNESSPLAVLMIDIDHFKAVNDTYGHAIGDLVIQHLADKLRVHFRSTDIIGRLGGEEFCVLLTGVDHERAQYSAERFRAAVAAQPAATKAGAIDYTVSIGFAWMKNNETLPALMQVADRALYRAKQHGRNCVMASNYWDKLTVGSKL